MLVTSNIDIAVMRSAICAEVIERTASQYKKTLNAIILTGSLARDEATVIEEDGSLKILGDADFLLVFRTNGASPSVAEIAVLQQTIEIALRQHSIECSIGLNAVVPTYLKSLPPHIFTYELRLCGLVIWGDRNILTLIPKWRVEDLALEDAWRLLCNRLVEFLEVAHDLPNTPLHYRTVKLYLDMATSLLVAQRCYEPTYQRRAERVRMLVDNPDLDAPFEMRAFSQRVTLCTDIKLGKRVLSSAGSEPNYGISVPSWREAIRDARTLWRYYLCLLTHARPNLTDDQLMRCWMGRQPVLQRLRGWLSVLRHSGYLRSRWEWLRWLHWVCVASPRYLLYAVTAEVLFELPTLTYYASNGLNRHGGLNLLRALPFRHRPARISGLPEWRLAAYEISRNYHDFLEKTRA